MVRDIVCGRLGLTRGLLRRMKKGGGIFLNGQRDYLSRRVRAGDQIQIVFSMRLRSCSRRRSFRHRL